MGLIDALPPWAFDRLHPLPDIAAAPPPAGLGESEIAAAVVAARAAYAALVADFAAHPPPLRKEPAPPKVIPLRRGAHPIALQWAREKGQILANYGGQTVELAFRDAPPEWRDSLTAGRGEGQRR